MAPSAGQPLSAVDREIASLLAAYRGHQLFQSVVTLMDSGGKRRRAEMVLAFAAAGEAPLDDAVGAAVVVEMLHAATLVHDDVIDCAGSRRGQTSANARLGNSAAVLGGDLLLALVSARAARIDSARQKQGDEVVGFALKVAQAMQRLVEGEALELQSAFDPGRSVGQYLAAIEGKTATLFALAAVAGLELGGGDAAATRYANGFALAYGKAFQITDDILDVVADPVAIGKPTLNDVREGVFTLPIILTAMKDPATRRVLGGRLVDTDVLREAVRHSRAIEESARYADDLLGRAERFADRLRHGELGAWCYGATGQLRCQLSESIESWRRSQPSSQNDVVRGIV